MSHFILDLINYAPATQPAAIPASPPPTQPGKPRGPLNEETKRKISEAKMGKPRSDETRAKISATMTGNTRRRSMPLAKRKEHGVISKAAALAGKGFKKPPGFRATMSKAATKREAAKRATRDATRHASGLGMLRPPVRGRTKHALWEAVALPVEDGKVLVTPAQLDYLIHLDSLAVRQEYLISAPFRDRGTITHMMLHGWRKTIHKRDPDNGHVNVFGAPQPCRMTSLRFLTGNTVRYVPLLTMELVASW